ncbi:phenylacetate--CoA ligase family protein [Apibacter sp. HY039]|uniref:phenylacetate--CoA ligase family protein n=1 Tax=Apibacter sp. HY039 TaxID=2501476 RepID=UPI000FEB6280|nr:AMP-binding protein [Apibacter sp. HY039]
MKSTPIDRTSLEKIKEFQEKRLKEQLEYVNKFSPYYSKLFKNHSIDISEIKRIEDLVYIPVTTKKELQANNHDFFCVSPDKIIDYVTTSGTSGDPVLCISTEKDLHRIALNESLSYEEAGLSNQDIIQLTTTLDRRFMAGIAYFLGAQQSGIGVIRVGSGVPELQWDTIQKIKPTVLVCVPSFLLKMIEFAEENSIDFINSSVKKAICIGEPIRNPDLTLNVLAKKITSQWNIRLYSTYASTEMATAFTECEYGKGGHHHPELVITEFLDENNQPVPEGEPGELTITHLQTEGMPLVRFKTGDIIQPFYEKCECGRVSLRVGPVIGRKNQMIKYKGTTLYPPSMFNLLNDFEDICNYVVEISSNDINEDEILIKIGVKNASENLLSKVKDHFRAKLRVSPRIKFMSTEEIELLKNPPNSRKTRLLIDKRNSVI